MSRDADQTARGEPPAWRLRFEPLAADAAAYEWPCDAAGRVEIDALDEAGRAAYFFARVMRRQRFEARVVPFILE